MAAKFKRKNQVITSDEKIILPKGAMCYALDIIVIAKKMDSKLILSATPEGKFFVLVENVWIKDGYRPKAVQGLGVTLGDACQDYLRQIRGETLLNIMTNKEDSFV